MPFPLSTIGVFQKGDIHNSAFLVARLGYQQEIFYKTMNSSQHVAGVENLTYNNLLNVLCEGFIL